MKYRISGLMATVGTIILWSMAPVFIKMLSQHFDPITQNFYRYFFSSILLAFLLLTSGEISKLKGHFKKLIIPASFVFLYQTILVYGIYMTEATVAAILMKTNVVFTTVLAFLLFREERSIISNPTYLLGTLLTFTGAVGIIMNTNSLQLTLDLGAILIVLSSLFWSYYIISIRILVSDVPPIPLSTVTFTLSSGMFFLLTITFGNLEAPLQAAPEANLLLIIFQVFSASALETGLIT